MCAFTRGIGRNVKLGREARNNAGHGLGLPVAPEWEHWCLGICFSQIPSPLHHPRPPHPSGGEGLRWGQPAKGMAILLVPPQGHAWWSGKRRGMAGKCDGIRSCWWGYARLPAFGSLCLDHPCFTFLWNKMFSFCCPWGNDFGTLVATLPVLSSFAET